MSLELGRRWAEHASAHELATMVSGSFDDLSQILPSCESPKFPRVGVDLNLLEGMRLGEMDGQTLGSVCTRLALAANSAVDPINGHRRRDGACPKKNHEPTCSLPQGSRSEANVLTVVRQRD